MFFGFFAVAVVYFAEVDIEEEVARVPLDAFFNKTFRLFGLSGFEVAVVEHLVVEAVLGAVVERLVQLDGLVELAVVVVIRSHLLRGFLSR